MDILNIKRYSEGLKQSHIRKEQQKEDTTKVRGELNGKKNTKINENSE